MRQYVGLLKHSTDGTWALSVLNTAGALTALFGFTGTTHATSEVLNRFTEGHKPDVVFLAGDHWCVSNSRASPLLPCQNPSSPALYKHLVRSTQLRLHDHALLCFFLMLNYIGVNS